jgi:hypothetical protein
MGLHAAALHNSRLPQRVTVRRVVFRAPCAVSDGQDDAPASASSLPETGPAQLPVHRSRVGCLPWFVGDDALAAFVLGPGPRRASRAPQAHVDGYSFSTEGRGPRCGQSRVAGKWCDAGVGWGGVGGGWGWGVGVGWGGGWGWGGLVGIHDWVSTFMGAVWVHAPWQQSMCPSSTGGAGGALLSHRVGLCVCRAAYPFSSMRFSRSCGASCGTSAMASWPSKSFCATCCACHCPRGDFSTCMWASNAARVLFLQPPCVSQVCPRTSGRRSLLCGCRL